MTKKSKAANPIDTPRPNQVGVSLSDIVVAKLDEFRAPNRLTRSHAAALLIERALESSQQTRSA